MLIDSEGGDQCSLVFKTLVVRWQPFFSIIMSTNGSMLVDVISIVNCTEKQQRFDVNKKAVGCAVLGNVVKVSSLFLL